MNSLKLKLFWRFYLMLKIVKRFSQEFSEEENTSKNVMQAYGSTNFLNELYFLQWILIHVLLKRTILKISCTTLTYVIIDLWIITYDFKPEFYLYRIFFQYLPFIGQRHFGHFLSVILFLIFLTEFQNSFIFVIITC